MLSLSNDGNTYCPLALDVNEFALKSHILRNFIRITLEIHLLCLRPLYDNFTVKSAVMHFDSSVLMFVRLSERPSSIHAEQINILWYIKPIESYDSVNIPSWKYGRNYPNSSNATALCVKFRNFLGFGYGPIIIYRLSLLWRRLDDQMTRLNLIRVPIDTFTLPTIWAIQA